MFDEKWDIRFINLARFVSEWSKDPSTQTGACVVDNDRRVVSVGYNGFAAGVKDKDERYTDRYNIKYKIILHCEENAIIFAERDRLKGSTLYTWPFMSCAKCAGLVINSGIKRVITKEADHVDLTAANDPNRWEYQFMLAKTQFEEAGVEMMFYPKDIFD